MLDSKIDLLACKIAKEGSKINLELILNFHKSMLASAGDKKLRPGGLPAQFWRPPAVILEGLGGLEA